MGPHRDRRPVDGAAPPERLDVAFELLSAARRRYVLYALHARDGAATVGELADHVVGLEELASDETSDRAEVVVALRHVHLPKLAEQGIVEYDGRSETVRYRGDDLVELLLDVAQACEFG